MVNEQQEALQSKWNFDGAEYMLVFEIKKDVVDSLGMWELEKAYWNLRRLRGEVDAKLNRGKKIKALDDDGNEEIKEIKETEKAEMDRKIKELSEARDTYNNSSKLDDDKSAFYQILEEFYLHICYIMKKHGVYFREGEDKTYAVLRR